MNSVAMNNSQTIDILNELLALEQASAPIRLLESTVFVSQLEVADAQQVRQMASESHEHAHWLTQLVLSLGGAPGLRMGDLRSAVFHFLELRAVLPELIDQEKTLIHKYTQALDQLSSEPQVREQLLRIMARHQDHLARFQQLDSNQSPTENA